MRLVPAHRSIIGAPVSGTVDDTYLAAWLTRGDPSHPVQTTGNLSLTVTPSAAQMMDVFAVCHHNISPAATIAISGTVSTSIATQPATPDGIPTNWYDILSSPASVSSLVLGITGNVDPIVVGEFYAGLSTLFPPLRLSRRLSPRATFPWEGEFGLMPPYDPGLHPPIRVRGDFVLTESQLNELHAAFVSQRNGSEPVLIIPDYPVNAAWLCVFHYEAEGFVPGEPPVGSPAIPEEMQAQFLVTLEIAEIPRVRWP